jgi:hypothetical protein
MTDGLSELRREEREQAAAEAAAAEAATAKKRKRPQYWYPEKPTKDEEDAHKQFKRENRRIAASDLLEDLKTAVDLVFEQELSDMKVDMLQPHPLNQLILEVSDRVYARSERVGKQRTAASVAAGSM